jgi:hypothetical protein
MGAVGFIKAEARLMMFKNSVRTSKRTPHFTIKKINWLMLFKEVMGFCNENHTKPLNTKYSVTDYFHSVDIQANYH